ncbi:MAG: ABC transporter permease [Rhizomicrobium sp.]
MLEQILAVTVMNLKTLHTRVWSSLVIMVGVAGVVGVLVSVLAMATGLVASMEHAGRRDRIIVLRGGSDTETSSQLSRASIATILDAPGIRRDGAGKVIGSAESVTVLARPMRSGGTDANVTLRGVGTEGLALRPEIRLVAGRWFKPGLHELVVGRAAQKQFAGLEIGDRISMSGQPWPVVGVFTSGGDTHESEVLTDAETVTIALRRSLFQSVTVLLNSPGDFAAFKRALTTNPQLSVEAQPEPDYFARTSSSLTTIMHFVAYVVGSIMAVGAIFGALNTMYSAVSARSVEIATLRAIGFGGLPVVISVLVEIRVAVAAGRHRRGGAGLDILRRQRRQRPGRRLHPASLSSCRHAGAHDPGHYLGRADRPVGRPDARAQGGTHSDNRRPEKPLAPDRHERRRAGRRTRSAEARNLGDYLCGLGFVCPLQIADRRLVLVEHRPQVGAQRDPFDISEIDIRDVHCVFGNGIARCTVGELRSGYASRSLKAPQSNFGVTRRQPPRFAMRKPAQFPCPHSLPRRDTCLKR